MDAHIRKKRNTALLMDAINSGNARDVRRIVMSDIEIDVDADVTELYEYAEVEKPNVMVDCIDKRRPVSPRKILGCALLRDDTRIVIDLLRYTNIRGVDDHDAIICLHYSTSLVHSILVDRFPLDMANKELYAGSANVIVGPAGYIANSTRHLYTPIHVLLVSLAMSQIVSNTFPRIDSFFRTQKAKYNYIVAKGGIFNWRMRHIAHVGTLTHLLLSNHVKLAKQVIVAKFLDAFDQTKFNIFIHRCIPRLRRNPILFFLYDEINENLHFPGNSNFQNKLLQHSFLQNKQRSSITKMTEFIVVNYFVFYGHSYKIRIYDTPSRLYNLFRAGVYLIDDLDYANDLPRNNQITRFVLQFIEESKTPFSLQFLCRLFIKRYIGPKDHMRKIQQLGLPTLFTDYIAKYKYTTESNLFFSDSLSLPHEHIPGRIRYFPDEDDLV